jgi:D-xylose transport system permease protein
MSDQDTVASAADKPEATTPPPAGPGAGVAGASAFVRQYGKRLRAGDMGSLPAVGGLIALLIFFAIVQKGFLSAYNMEALVTQAAPIAIMAMGLVFVLLLGEIDLSAGTASGVCAALMASLMARQGQPWPVAVLAAIATGVVIGFVIGLLRAKLGIPSFVSSLAFFLGFQGITLLIVGNGGSIRVSDKTIVTIQGLNRDFVPVALGWVLLVLVVAGFLATKLYDARKRAKFGLSIEPWSVVGFKALLIAGLGAGFVQLMSVNRLHSSNAFFTVTAEGMPWVVLVVAVLLFGLTFVLNRTRYGRHVYAVGGNDEAARRAGIRVDRVRISVFVICSAMAAVAGIVAASLQEGVNSDAGAKNELLLAVGAAVIGGTSLFGGRGRVIDGLIGGLVVAVIQNGMSDLIQGSNSSSWQYVVTGAVLLLAAGVDAISRRGSKTRG